MNRSGNTEGPDNNNEKDMHKGREQPVYLWDPHCKVGIPNLLRHCKERPEDKKKRLREQISENKTKTAQLKSTRAPILEQTDQQSTQQRPPQTKGRLSHMRVRSTIVITLKADGITISCVQKCDGDADESIASLRLA